MPPTVLGAQIAAHCRAGGYEAPEPEYQFHPTRKWRFDFAFPAAKVAVEYEGTTGGKGGRHQRREGYAEDAVKYTEAALLGWKVIRVTSSTVKHLWDWLDRAFSDKEST